MNFSENDTEKSRFEISRDIILRLQLKTKPKVITFATKEVMCCCPWHKDTNPSCGIDLVNGRFHCFSCGRSGSVESMFKEFTGESYYTPAAKSPFLNAKFKWNTWEVEDNTKPKNVFVNYDPNDFVDFTESPDALKYLRSRGVTRSAAKSLNIQYAENTRINTTLFKRRIIIPVYENGVLVSIEGRSIDPENKPKVLYPKNCTTSTLLDIDNLDFDDTCYAVEGVIDLAVLRSCPTFKNSTSIFGANLTARQLELIKKFKKFVYIYDLDAAGEGTVEQLKDAKLPNTYILKLPEIINGTKIKDVGDLPKAGVMPQTLVNRNWLNYIKRLN